MAIAKPGMDLESFAAWRATRPAVVQEMIDRCPPDRLYRINSGHRVTLYSYNEDGTVTVEVSGEFNRVLFARRVFGIPITELVECDLPDDDEDLGDTSAEAGYDADDVEKILIPKLLSKETDKC